MKKSFFKNTLLLALPIAICFSACSDDKESKYEPAPVGQTTVYGHISADLILNNGTIESAPAGTKINAWIDGKELVLNPVPNVTYPTKYYTATVDANGNYTLTVDAANKEVTIHIDPTTFEYNLTLENGTQKMANYKANGSTKTGYNGQSQRLDFDYTHEFQTGSELGLATIKGKIFYKYNMCKGDGSSSGGIDTQSVAAPNGTIIIATWKDDSGADRTLEVPVQNGEISFTIETKKTGGSAGAVTVTLNGRSFYAERRNNTTGSCDIEADEHKYDFAQKSESAKKGETTLLNGGKGYYFQ